MKFLDDFSGIVGDGSAVTTAALQNAIDLCEGKEIDCCEYSLLVDGTITIPSGTRLHNRGKFIPTSGLGIVVLVDGKTETILDDVSVVGDKTGSCGYYGLYYKNGSRNTILNSSVSSTTCNGVTVEGETGFRMTGGFLTDCGAEAGGADNHALSIVSLNGVYTHDFLISGVHVQRAWRKGVSVYVDGPTSAVYDGEITGCAVENDGGLKGLGGIYLGAVSSPACVRVSVHDNRVNNYYVNLEMFHAIDCVVHHNIFGATLSDGPGVELNTCYDTVFAGNSVVRARGVGVNIVNSTGLKIATNTVKYPGMAAGAGTTAIKLASAQGCYVHDNTIMGAGTPTLNFGVKEEGSCAVNKIANNHILAAGTKVQLVAGSTSTAYDN